ncbi:Uncharacterised protein [Mycolicibacterium vanbaalenii]|uniref:Uncharacterized protein n=1 Tax=Mycolicibacterium vanbaalenii TaxID=110539 RepID=A0A5S9QN88_MYCVN|nr:DUF1801 domain-containing protein [Mycolicibacterium vanbaalenii]CAA0119871.1 Uncharacterised protein [Mycolicibacterium vanbaalenii]
MSQKKTGDHKTDEDVVRDKIAELPAFRDVASRLHEIIMKAAPELKPRLWYGMPGYAKSKSSPVICFFRVDADDYVSFGLTEKAALAPEEGAPHKLIGLVPNRNRRTRRSPDRGHRRTIRRLIP